MRGRKMLEREAHGACNSRRRCNQPNKQTSKLTRLVMMVMLSRPIATTRNGTTSSAMSAVASPMYLQRPFAIAMEEKTMATAGPPSRQSEATCRVPRT